ncbi:MULTISPECIES: F0F1 ATP synthase subunit gamma [Thermomonosporaceae]|uniref:F0F1 ATP synthase subunit gamma n=1 Tax=Thermomonosporaceae TaxID=2012 RepID=UPI00255AC745|nr:MULTISPECIES: F0F1 ATP synthase subunit gamma [Thermomonosporaceae]MDL4777141.1 F0F1 ATP synthase subunit gamma [Actinomadura xylanilytica]
MAAQLRALRSRIRSVRSTAKITRAQELIAAARISRARQRVAAAEPYARQVTAAVSALISHHVHLDHPLLNERPDASRVAVLLLTSDRGFCGGYNHNVLKQGESLAGLLREQGSEPVFYLVGRKAVDNFRFRRREAVKEWAGSTGQPAYELAAEIGGLLLDAFDRPTRDGGVGGVHVVYTEFVSMLNQRTTVRRILPLEVEEVAGGGPGARAAPAYDFEPAPASVLDGLLRQYVNGRVWHMLLEAAASEHAARRAAMMAATDNADELIGTLTRQANEARQEEVTNELSEIVAGANSLAGRPG